MANNPYVNKVVFGSATLVDLTGTTATADKILQGYGAFGADGAWMDGTATSSSGSGAVWQDAQGYVHLSDEGDIPLQTKTVAPSETAQTVTPDNGYYALEQVNVGAVSSTYVGSGITRRSSSDLTASGATVTVPSGYYSSNASKAVASGSAGTPTATKGTVSNHSVSVTPSVLNTTGYISGGTKTGTAVSVSASELVSGTKSITENGTGIDVTNYARVDVDVPTGGGGSGLVYESGTWTPSADTADYTISFTGTHTTAPFFYVINDSEGDYYTEANSNIQVRFVCSSLLGVDLHITATNIQYATIASQYRGTSTTSFNSNNTTVTTNSSAALSDYATSTGIRAYTNATSRYWRAGRAYKWIAVWAPTI